MSNCCSCIYSDTYERCDFIGKIWYCTYGDDKRFIDHPHFMGGSKRCPCYEKKAKKRFIYPTPNEVNK